MTGGSAYGVGTLDEECRGHKERHPSRTLQTPDDDGVVTQRRLGLAIVEAPLYQYLILLLFFTNLYSINPELGNFVFKCLIVSFDATKKAYHRREDGLCHYQYHLSHDRSLYSNTRTIRLTSTDLYPART